MLRVVVVVVLIFVLWTWLKAFIYMSLPWGMGDASLPVRGRRIVQ